MVGRQVTHCSVFVDNPGELWVSSRSRQHEPQSAY